MKQENRTEPMDEIDLLENVYQFIIPKYREIHDIIVTMLDFETESELRIVDLGCGLGDLSRRILEVFSKATIFGIDNNEAILKRCHERLSQFEARFLPMHRDLNDLAWMHELEAIDAVVSSFTLDYLALDRHKKLLAECFDLLNPQGRYLSCEFFKAVDTRVNRIFHDIEIQFVHRAMKDGKISQEQIDGLARSSILRQPHHVCTLETKIEWLRVAGFDKIDVPWKFLNLAVISAVRT